VRAGTVSDDTYNEVKGVGSHLATSVLFFFKAEDGIRDRNVTGVQTCALPILPVVTKGDHFSNIKLSLTSGETKPPERFTEGALRSEERRVGKEGGAGGGQEEKRQEGGANQGGHTRRRVRTDRGDGMAGAHVAG